MIDQTFCTLVIVGGKFLEAARDIEGFEIYKMGFYIDDGDIGSEAFSPGSRYEGGMVVGIL